jgi:hypothetical protein
MRHLAGLPDGRASALSRTVKGPESDGVRRISADLTQPGSCEHAADDLKGVDALFYAIRPADPDPQVEAEVNTRMLVNLLRVLEEGSPALRYICLIHGTRWYGNHLGHFKAPAEETDPHPAVPTFYYGQQDHVARRQPGKRWTWSALRPHIVCGVSTDYPSNLMTLLAVYGTLCRGSLSWDSMSSAVKIREHGASRTWWRRVPRCYASCRNCAGAA